MVLTMEGKGRVIWLCLFCTFQIEINNVKTFQSRLFVGAINNSDGSEIGFLFLPS
jgi:hypothetical protein